VILVLDARSGRPRPRRRRAGLPALRRAAALVGMGVGAGAPDPPARRFERGSPPATRPVPRSCRGTQVLLPASCLPRCGDATAVVGAVLAAKAAGRGHRSIAADLSRPPSTVRRWLRRTRGRHAQWLRGQGVEHASRLAPTFSPTSSYSPLRSATRCRPSPPQWPPTSAGSPTTPMRGPSSAYSPAGDCSPPYPPADQQDRPRGPLCPLSDANIDHHRRHRERTDDNPHIKPTGSCSPAMAPSCSRRTSRNTGSAGLGEGAGTAVAGRSGMGGPSVITS
jgi:hypothetical protein